MLKAAKSLESPLGRDFSHFCMLGVGKNGFLVQITNCYRTISATYPAIDVWLDKSNRLVFYSQRGNILFPGWEYYFPSVGIKLSKFGRLRYAIGEAVPRNVLIVNTHLC